MACPYYPMIAIEITYYYSKNKRHYYNQIDILLIIISPRNQKIPNAIIIAGINGICASLDFRIHFLNSQNKIHNPLLNVKYHKTICVRIIQSSQLKIIHAHAPTNHAIRTSPSQNHSVNCHILRVCHRAAPR